MASKLRFCPFCPDIFDQTEIKDHIGMTHFKPIILGDQNQHVKEALLTSLGLNPMVLSEKLTPEDLQNYGLVIDQSINQNSLHGKDGLAKKKRKLKYGKTFPSKRIKEEFMEEYVVTKDQVSEDINVKMEAIDDSELKIKPEPGLDQSWIDQSVDFKHEVTQFQCAKCSIMFKHKNHLVRHVQSVHEGLRFPCKLCPMIYSRQDGLVYHLRTKHGEAPKNPRVGKASHPIFKTKSARMDQLKHKYAKARGYFPCKECPKVFTQNQNLWRHVKGVHKGLQNHECAKCQKRFTLKENLSRHVKSIHEGVRYDCKVCDKSYADPNSLYRHKKTHTFRM